MQTIKLGLLGLGTVGGGTVNVLHKNCQEIERRLGCSIQVVIAAVKNVTAPRICNCEGFELTTDAEAVVNHPEVDIVLELQGDIEPAKSLVLKAIKNRKPVVTANKALIALHGNEIFAKAAECGVPVMYEAAVAGGIGIIKGIREGLAANQIESLAGIINGTGNFILTEMEKSGQPFQEVLKQAQQLGYAEADPTFDIEGIDAAHKLTILASIAFGVPLNFEKVVTQGISQLDLQDIAYAQELGFKLKHLGIAKRDGEQLELRVHPTLIPENSLMANVNGVLNAVLVQSNAVGESFYSGAGAGAEPTASAVVADVIDIVRAKLASSSSVVPEFGFQADKLQTLPIKSSDEFITGYYLRFDLNTQSDADTVIKQLSEYDIVATQTLRKGDAAHQSQLVLLIEPTRQARINTALASVERQLDLKSPVVQIRVEALQ